MGGVGGEGDPTRADRLRAAFLGSFLTVAELPPGMCRIRPPGITAPDPPAPQPGRGPAGHAVHQDHAVWLGSPDAELYRLDDARWLLPSPRRAAGLARELLGPQAIPPSAGGAAPGPARLQVVRGTPTAGYLQVIQLGPVVARLQAVPGEDSALPDGLDANLGRLVAQRIAELAGAAAGLRRPGWHPARWIRRPGG
ncbi:hypothetical protein FraQA3DRAFT_4224 [Frankia sp. QA3]|nr:hypothetical protein FraQA3DRAFT_4224 [Frankia sp. QA3]